MQVWSLFEDVKDAGVAISFGNLLHQFVSLTGEAGKRKDWK